MVIRELVVPTGSRRCPVLTSQPQDLLQVDQLWIQVRLYQTPFGVGRHQSSFESEWPRSPNDTGLNVRYVLEKGWREQYWLGQNLGGLDWRHEKT